jgi:hypothetical protein
MITEFDSEFADGQGQGTSYFVIKTIYFKAVNQTNDFQNIPVQEYMFGDKGQENILPN